MRVPSCVSSRNAAWPSQVRVVSGMRELLRGLVLREPTGAGPSDAATNLSDVGSRLLASSLAAAALVLAAAGLGGGAFWLGLLAVAAAAVAAFAAAADALEGRAGALGAVSTGLALACLVLGSAVRASSLPGAGAPQLASWALLA